MGITVNKNYITDTLLLSVVTIAKAGAGGMLCVN